MGRSPSAALLVAAMSSASTIALAQTAAIAPAAAALSASSAPTGDVRLEEVVVTATKRSENLQNVPMAVSAITGSALTKQGVFETSDLNHSAPNLQVSSPYGEQQPNFSLRGVGVGTEYNANAASPVGVYVDEVYQAFRSSHGQQLYDLNQVEVVRGPQGTLYGRNTTGGAINFITRQPKLDAANGYLTAGYGDYDRGAVEGAVEYTPIEDKLGFRLAGTYVRNDPYVQNLLLAGLNKSTPLLPDALAYGNQSSGIQPGITESWGVRAQVRYKPTSRVDLLLKGYAADATGGTETPIATGQSATSDTIDYTNPTFLLSGLFSALAPLGLLPTSYSAAANGLTTQQVQADTVGKAASRSEGVVFTGRFTLTDDLKLINITGYDSGLYEQSSTDCDATPLRLCAIGYQSRFEAWNEDARLDYSHGRLKAILGGYFGHDTIVSDNTPDFFNILSDVRSALGLPPSYFNPGGNFNGTLLPATALPTGIRATQHYKQVRESYAVYSEVNYKITPAIGFTGGVRYTHDTDQYRDGLSTFYDDAGVARLITVSNYAGGAYFLQSVMDATGKVVLPSFPSLGIPLPGGLEKTGTSGQVSGRAILDWKPTEDMMVYASFSHGYRAGTFNGLAYAKSSQVYFVPPETVNAYEIGMKSRWLDNRLQLNSAFFYYDYQGQQAQVVDSTATANLVSLSGALYGLELEAQYAPTRNLHLNAALGLLHSTYDHGTCPLAPIVSSPPQVGNCVASGTGNVDIGGDPFPYAANASVNLGFDWDIAEFNDAKITLHGDANYTGKFYYDVFGNYSKTPALMELAQGVFHEGGGDDWVANARLTYGTPKYSISIWVKNLTDTVYYPYGISIEQLFGNGYRVRALPRTFGGEVSVRF
jgi:iron complex outermembrane receptor protein